MTLLYLNEYNLQQQQQLLELCRGTVPAAAVCGYICGFIAAVCATVSKTPAARSATGQKGIYSGYLIH